MFKNVAISNETTKCVDRVKKVVHIQRERSWRTFKLTLSVAVHSLRPSRSHFCHGFVMHTNKHEESGVGSVDTELSPQCGIGALTNTVTVRFYCTRHTNLNRTKRAGTIASAFFFLLFFSTFIVTQSHLFHLMLNPN